MQTCIHVYPGKRKNLKNDSKEKRTKKKFTLIKLLIKQIYSTNF